jgi:hypothetical protein
MSNINRALIQYVPIRVILARKTNPAGGSTHRSAKFGRLRYLDGILIQRLATLYLGMAQRLGGEGSSACPAALQPARMEGQWRLAGILKQHQVYSRTEYLDLMLFKTRHKRCRARGLENGRKQEQIAVFDATWCHQ